MPYMKKFIYSGNILELEIYPTTKLKGQKIPSRKEDPNTPDAQKRINEKNSKKNFYRTVECNFTENDLFLTLSYKERPTSKKEFKADFQNFIRRLKYQCRKKGLPEPKYMAVSHMDKRKRNALSDEEETRPHHHIILNCYSWDLLLKIWKKGNVKIGHLERESEESFMQVSNYIMNVKNENCFDKRWCASKNLKKPTIKYKEVKKIDPFKPIAIPKGYRLIKSETSESIYTGIHQYAKFVKIIA